MKKFFNSCIHKSAFVAVMDALILAFSDILALLLYNNLNFTYLSPDTFRILIWWLPIQIIVTVVLFSIFHLYSFVWHMMSLFELMLTGLFSFISFFISLLIGILIGLKLPLSVFVIILILQMVLQCLMRASVKIVKGIRISLYNKESEDKERVMIVGAGEAGKLLLHEYILNVQIKNKIVCFVDDNPVKKGKFLDGIKILYDTKKIPEYVTENDIGVIIFAIPSATSERKKEILEICSKTGCRIKTLPSLYQLMSNPISEDIVKDVQAEDLLGRESIVLDSDSIRNSISGKTVLVTGGGGSIGSELCRQMSAYSPEKLIILDIYENNAYDIQQELKRRYGDNVSLCVEIASIRDYDKLIEIFDRYKPDIVFHAAAHKHVPLMEGCPGEAVKNNIFGTYNVMNASEKCGVQKFVMISTDKAVNPTSVMGTTKRYCEMMLQSRYDSKTEFCTVRFGNVLGSNGSVVPLFKRQIEEGGPVTITDKRIIRFFMTIPEAAQLVLEAAAIAKNRQVFVLDMGEPVKILTMAENLIRLSGYEPYKDIDIKEIGLRPGEKLYEEILMSSTDLDSTNNKKIFIEKQACISKEEIENGLRKLSEYTDNSHSSEDIKLLLKHLVSTYRDPDEVNKKAAI